MVGERGCFLRIKVEGGDTSFPHTPLPWRHSVLTEGCEYLVISYGEEGGDTSFPHTPLPWRHSVLTEGCEYLVISYGEEGGDACVSTGL